MRPVRIAGADPKPLGAPSDWNPERHGHCGALFIRRECLDGVPYMRSAWEAEAVEATLLLAGASVHLGVQGTEHPVVQLGVGHLPDDFEPTLTARCFADLQGRRMVRVDMLYPYAGGRRGWCEVPVSGSMADAISTAVSRIETLALKEGWIG